MADPTAPNLQFGRREQDSGIIVKLELLHDDVSDMKSVLREMTAAINRLALVEERQATTAVALERAFTVLKELESRMSTLEKTGASVDVVELQKRTAVLELANVNTSRTSSLVDQSIWLVLAGVIGAVMAYLGLKK
jgi:hypothetical protein